MALAPELIRVEVASALCRRVRKGELAPDEAEARCQHWLAALDSGLFSLTPDKQVYHPPLMSPGENFTDPGLMSV